MVTGYRRAAAPVVVLLAATLVACGPSVPESVVPGTQVTVGWTGTFTSVNAAASPTAGNLDVAEMIRGDFGDVIDGEFVPDEGFGTVEIVADDPFTVRFDLAEPSWSDGIPLDAADLVLGWAGAAGAFALEPEATAATSTSTEQSLVGVDEFARSVDIAFSEPSVLWQQAVTVPVPAHIVGQKAFGIDDPMEAKQAVIEAVQSGDKTALASITDVWNTGFEIVEGADIPAALRLSSGPFSIDEATESGDGQSVELVPNGAYRGLVSPQIARVSLVPPGDDAVAALGDTLDLARVSPVASTRTAVRDLERTDFIVDTSHDGTTWAVVLKPTGTFARPQVRAAFIRAIPAGAMVERGGGQWASAYAASTSVVSAPGARAYDIVNEDSGFTEQLGSPADDPAVDRQDAGASDGTRVCVLYDRRSEFATGAFAALREGAREGGWDVTDCSTDDFGASLKARGWDAVITRIAVPRTPADIAAQWGSGSETSIARQSDPERDELIAQYAHTSDVYQAREVLAQIEATIVRAAVVRPLAVNPRVSVIDRDVTGIAPRSGSVAPWTYGAAQWAVVP